MKIEVDFPTTWLPKDRELLGAELRKPKDGEYFFCAGSWHKTSRDFDIYEPLVAILSPEDTLVTLRSGESK